MYNKKHDLFEMEDEMKRDTSIDIAKGFGILLVILGHVPTIPDELKKIIYAFHIPLFFFISGYLYNSIKYNLLTPVQFVRSRIQRYIVPYFIIGFICFFLFGVIFNLVRDGYSTEYLKSISKFLFGLLYSRGGASWMAWSSPLWFLTCLFVSELILYFVLKHSKKQYIVFIILAVVGYCYTLITKFPLPWNIDVALIATGFMYIGNICRKHNVIDKFKNRKYIAVLFFVLLISILFNSQIDFNLRNFGNIILTYVGGVSGTILVILLANTIKKSIFLEFIGVNSLLMMGYTYAVLNIVMLFYGNFKILQNVFVNFFIQVVLLSTLVIVILKIKQLININVSNSTRIKDKNKKRLEI